MHFVAHGLLGWAGEIVWTAGYEAMTGTRRGEQPGTRVPIGPGDRFSLMGRTYLWMFPLYGLCAFTFEPLHEAMRHFAFWARGGVYMAGLFAVEAAAGLILRAILGRCPWDYSYARASVGGVIRLDYAPLWFAVGLGLERVHDLLVRVLGG